MRTNDAHETANEWWIRSWMPGSADSLDGGRGDPHGRTMGVTVSCPRCGARVRPPDLMHSAWRCDNCGDVPPFHAAKHINAEIVEMVLHQHAPTAERVPLWCP